VEYAKERHIIVVPEIEMPGHVQAALAAYPELGNNPSSPVEPWDQFGVSYRVLNVEESTVEFFQDILREVMDVFPSRVIHVGAHPSLLSLPRYSLTCTCAGGDECPRSEWESTERVQRRIRELQLGSAHDLQPWFMRQMDAFLTDQGRHMLGWDEILEGGLAPNAMIMSWRGPSHYFHRIGPSIFPILSY